MVKFDFARPLSAMKYGLLMIVAAIPAFTMVVIVAWVFGEMMSSVFEGGDIEGGLIFGAIGGAAAGTVIQATLGNHDGFQYIVNID